VINEKEESLSEALLTGIFAIILTVAIMALFAII
jgi:hypothetical protein